MILRNVGGGAVVASAVNRATNALSRGVGLLGRSTLGPDEGLWIDGCNAVHTMFMRVPLDLYFLDREGRVLKIAPNVPPWRFIVSCKGAAAVLELGVADARAVSVGDRLTLEGA